MIVKYQGAAQGGDCAMVGCGSKNPVAAMLAQMIMGAEPMAVGHTQDVQMQTMGGIPKAGGLQL